MRLLVLVALLFSFEVHAESWVFLGHGKPLYPGQVVNDTSYDTDSFTKKENSATVWVKYTNPDRPDESRQRLAMDCSSREYVFLEQYDLRQKSNGTIEKVQIPISRLFANSIMIIVPNSDLEQVYTAACNYKPSV